MSLAAELPTTEDLVCAIRFGHLRSTLGELLEEVAARVFDPVDGAGPDEDG